MSETPLSRARRALARDAAVADPALWITRLPDEAVLARAAVLEAGEALPLHGLTVAVKVSPVRASATSAGAAGSRVTEARGRTVMNGSKSAGMEASARTTTVS